MSNVKCEDVGFLKSKDLQKAPILSELFCRVNLLY